jgi:hypothetical protein
MGSWIEEGDRQRWIDKLEMRIENGAEVADVRAVLQFAERELKSAQSAYEVHQVFDIIKMSGDAFRYDSQTINDVISALAGAARNSRKSIRLLAIRRLVEYGDHDSAVDVLIERYEDEEKVMVKDKLRFALGDVAELQSGESKMAIRDVWIADFEDSNPMVVLSAIAMIDYTWWSDPVVVERIRKLGDHMDPEVGRSAKAKLYRIERWLEK